MVRSPTVSSLGWASPTPPPPAPGFNIALDDADIKLVSGKRGPALADVKLNDMLPIRPPDTPDVGPYVRACLERTHVTHAISRDKAWRLYLKWADGKVADNEYARRRFFAAMRRRTKEVRRSEGWYYPGVRPKDGVGIPSLHRRGVRRSSVATNRPSRS
jgi:hypothetical protein